MDRIAIILFALVISFLSGCSMSAKKPEKVLNLRDVYDVEVCPLHHVPLQDGVEPIKAGHISWDFRYLDARNKIFPLANIGDITDYEASKALVVFCPECRKAKERWMDEEKQNERISHQPVE